MASVFRNKILWVTIVGLFFLWGLAPGAYAQDAVSTPQISAGDTAWVLTSSALVLAMIVPGLALFYGGIVRSKNVLSTMMHSFIAICLVSVVWVFWGIAWLLDPMLEGLLAAWTW